MMPKILPFFVCPLCKSGFSLEAEKEGAHVKEGKLHCKGCGRIFEISKGIPRLVIEEEVDDWQKQTSESFDFKWRLYPQFALGGGSRKFHDEWFYKKYHWAPDDFKSFLFSKKLILDAGTGTGHDIAWFAGMTNGEVFGTDISGCVDVAYKNTESLPNSHIIQADIMNLPFKEETFEFITSEGVLHHTPSTRLALESLVRLLCNGGEIQFYVYRKKGPIREFCDDYIRQYTTQLAPEKCWEICESLTKLGKAFSELKSTVEIPDDIPLLQIKKGKYDLQRFVYYNFLKCFWNGTLTYEENVLTNFDWYHPKYAYRHTPEEVKTWLEKLGLKTIVFDAGESGISVRAVK